MQFVIQSLLQQLAHPPDSKNLPFRISSKRFGLTPQLRMSSVTISAMPSNLTLTGLKVEMMTSSTSSQVKIHSSTNACSKSPYREQEGMRLPEGEGYLFAFF